VYKKASVLSGGERTRLAVARMLLRPSNTLLLDEPTNHLDLDSKDILLEALEDFGGTLIFVSHDRYFVEKLANKIVEIGHGEASMFPGTYTEFLWSKEQRLRPRGAGGERADGASSSTGAGTRDRQTLKKSVPSTKESTKPKQPHGTQASGSAHHEARKRLRSEEQKRNRETEKLQSRIAELEAQIAERERTIRDLEAAMAEPGFYGDRARAQEVADRHQGLMWEVGDLMHQWEELQKKLMTIPS
jgi:ATP-binding cassette subfamily F protein 3